MRQIIASETERRPALHRLVAAGTVPKALALDDGVAAHFIDRRLVRIVTSRPDARGYEVRRQGSRSAESALPVIALAPDGRMRSRPVSEKSNEASHEP